MKKQMKKMLLLAAVIATAMLCLAFSASAETWGDYEFYSDYQTGNITITKYNGNATSVTIPSKIGGKAVVELEGTFYGNKKVKSVKIPNTVTTIDWCAFADCTALKSITIPNSVTTIGSSAFSDCDALKSITIPSSVTTIGGNAFSGCDALKSITIPGSVTTIGGDAFSNCDALTSVKIPDSVTGLGVGAFSKCAALKSVTLSKNLKTIGDSAFYDCEALTSVKIPSGVTSIGEWAFYACDALTSVTIPNSVKTIDEGAFNDCESLTSITIPSSVKTIGARVFANCDALTSITIPNSVTSVGDYAFSSCDALSKVTMGKKVKTIGAYAFSGCRQLEGITLTATVKSIGENAFEKHDEYDYFSTVVYCPKGSYASKWAKKAGQPYAITNPSGKENIVKGKIGKYTWTVDKLSGVLKLSGSGKMNYFADTNAPWYNQRYYITSISFPKGLTEIGENAFRYLYRIKSLTIPGTVKVIGDYAFAYCYGLKSAVLNKGVTTISHGAFLDCEALEKITISDSVTSIGTSAFSGCKSLKSIKIPDSVTEIGVSAFRNCDSLTTITIPGSVISTHWYWFDNCDNLKEVILEKGVESIGMFTFDDLETEGCRIVIKNKNCSFSEDCGLNYTHTIWGYKGSTAEAYADEIGAEFIDINHKHVYKNKTTKATLTKNGKITPTCKVCGKTTKATTIYYPKSIKLSATSFTYNGKAISPAVTVKDSKGNVLKAGTDYKVVYSSGRTNPGSYVAKITFKGKYSGVKRITFTIKPATPVIKAVASTAKGRAAVAWTNVAGESGYEVYYSTKKDSGYKGFAVSNADVVKVAKNGLASGKTYYFKVRAYKTVGDTKLYSALSAAKSIKIK